MSICAHATLPSASDCQCAIETPGRSSQLHFVDDLLLISSFTPCSRRLVDQALDDLVAAELDAAVDTVRTPAFGVSHTGSDPRTTATSSLMCVRCLPTGQS